MSAVHPLHSLPLSPSSPPESGLKRQKRRLSDDSLPDSANSPPLMSVTANGYVSIYAEARPGTSDLSQSEPVDMQRQTSVSALPTPANSVAGSMKAGELEDADQHRDKRQRFDTEECEAGEQTIAGTSIRPTNHERQRIGSSSSYTANSSEIKRDAGLGLFLAKSRYPKVTRLQPDPNEHLLSIYGLNEILKAVARVDPATNKKIDSNSMRKSYEGQIKKFELAGLNKPVKKEVEPPFNLGRLMTTYRTPPTRDGFEIHTHLKEKLPRAMQFQPGKLGKRQDEWDRVLGNDKPKPPPLPAVQPPAPLRATVRQHIGKPSQERPRRQGKRRRYNDESYEGYADGYVDEDESESEGERGSARKRQRRPDLDEY